MKKLLLLLFIAIISVATYAQTDGLHYQAMIIDPNVQELPGNNATGNILPNTDVTLRFTIFNAAGNRDYSEIQNTRTDAYGMVNVIIGQGQPQGTDLFTEIFWDGTRKDLKVEIQFNGRFTDLSNQSLTFIPYAFHRDIIATGNMDVDGNVILGGNLVVEGTTDLNDRLLVNNESPTLLSGSLTVDGATNLNSTLDVTDESPTHLTGILLVDLETQLRSTLEVDGFTVLNDNLRVEGATELNSTLGVDGVTNLNSTLEVDGATQLNSTLTVIDATQLNSTLEVDGATTLNNTLDVTNQSPTRLTGTLTVDGVTNLNDNVSINNNSSLNVSGDLVVQGSTLFEDDLTVDGDTNLNGLLNVNNNSPTNLSGTLNVANATTLGSSLTVDGPTNLENELNVNNQSPTNLSGSLTVDLGTELNSSLSVNNGSPTLLTGTLDVEGAMNLNNNLTVNGVTNLNSFVFVNNGAPTNLSGELNVAGDTDMDGTLIVDGATTLNQGLTVANASDTYLTGTLEVDGETTLNNSLDVTNQSPTYLSGTLTVDEATTLNSSLDVTNASPTTLTGTLDVDGATTINNSLSVLNGSETKLTGTLTVDEDTNLNSNLTVLNGSDTNLSGILNVTGATTLDNTLTVAGATTINNDLTVTGNTFLGSLNTQSINISGDNPAFVATFENTNTGDGDGIAIRLGKNHGAWDGTQILQIVNPLIGDPDAGIPPIDPTYQSAINIIKTQFQSPGTFSVSDMINLAPGGLRSGGILSINEFVFQQMNSSLGLPKNLPGVNFPFTTLTQTPTPPPPFPGVTIPFVNVTIPGWQVPSVSIPSQVLNSPIGNFIPSLPLTGDNTGGLPGIDFPTIPTQAIAGSLNKNNEYVSFQDKDGRVTGSIRAQSLQDFANETICNPVYLMNVISKFIGVDLLDKVVAGSVEMTNLIEKFNHIGVEYTSGNGDYAEWLPRSNAEEYITAGDIVAVKGGFITKDLENVEQIMVVSHRPIILGNTPDPERTHLGNNVAFMGQVPVKVMGPVETGDYIVADTTVRGYGVAKSQEEMQAEDFVLAVGRSWEENQNEGPKMVNTVVGVHNGDWVSVVQKLQQKQKAYEAQFKAIEAKVNALDQKAEELLENNH
ncbi:hypothetical protein POV27_01255 [Aureisphaera galaxeae]|uniref:hypothetical protein n=1 Tax=Aureisphaera galaxeae TaxID=1538023 RepID=UPI0023509BFC|nr:hypothetical protein [Aureisphaera galaxeae]MDC8002665.1 hypothetical protein [Aureisphaera galaxeae]